MLYEITVSDWSPAGKEIRDIVDTILKPIQLRRGSPNLLVKVATTDQMALVECPNPDTQASYYGPMLKTVAAMIFRKGQVTVSALVKFAKVENPSLFGYHHVEVISLFESNSLERIRGMVDKSLRVLYNGLNKPKRKHEPSATRRGRRPRVGRSVGRFSAV